MIYDIFSQESREIEMALQWKFLKFLVKNILITIPLEIVVIIYLFQDVYCKAVTKCPVKTNFDT